MVMSPQRNDSWREGGTGPDLESILIPLPMRCVLITMVNSRIIEFIVIVEIPRQQ